ncbi:hypothetical protein [Aurantiacibacter sp. D1-12]|uniref:hypothetical protein n=1 Tax=Aurantiacibacter sp. D1-12 TaxID=2993658 RepID=UPI00237D2AC0|nr:hypothetical protein [Aurantiacibacter sp. D1-12]MDE1468360.1 hypothetical protein [Aurantiacibacter sp. D1-12]
MADRCASGAHGLDARCAPVLALHHFRFHPEPKSDAMDVLNTAVVFCGTIIERAQGFGLTLADEFSSAGVFGIWLPSTHMGRVGCPN